MTDRIHPAAFEAAGYVGDGARSLHDDGTWKIPAGGGASALDDLSDVDTTTSAPTDGDTLTFDTASGLWVPGAPTGGGTGVVESVVAGTGISVDSTDPANPVVSATGGGGGGAAGRVLLSQVSISVAASTISFASGVIPASGYSHLQLEISGRASTAGTNEYIRVYFNGDTTPANYSTKHWYGTTGTGYNVYADAYAFWTAAAGATANKPGVAKMFIPDYLGTTWHKTGLSEYYSPGSPLVGQSALSWANAAAIASLTLNLAGGGNFVPGTKAWLYALA